MEYALSDEARAGLRGTLNTGNDRKIPLAGPDDLRPVLGEKENAGWLQKEIPFTIRSVDRRDLEADPCS